jgi:uncharacterized protein YjiS (DUF1127 family)
MSRFRIITILDVFQHEHSFSICHALLHISTYEMRAANSITQTKGIIMFASSQSLMRVVLRSPGFPIATYLRLARQRRDLAQLDDARLEDLGLSRREALREAQRPIWDVPSNWKK